MKTEIDIDHVDVEDFETVIKKLKVGEKFKLMASPIIDDDDEDFENYVSVWLEHEDLSQECTIMFSITKEQALYFGKSLTALGEII